MKKLFTVILSAVILLSMGIVSVSAAADESVDVYVTITDAQGAIAVAAESITVTDTDGDGAITINDALYTAHERFYEGGAQAGYASSIGQYGLSLDKLWGSANGGSYGYYVNNASAWSLADTIADGDYVAAYVYTDLAGWSDTYSFFDNFKAEVKAGEEVTVTLSAATFDANWNPITVPVEGAKITVDGVAIDAVTDADGKAAFTLNKNGAAVISATSEDMTLVPPVLRAVVTGAEEPTTAETTATADEPSKSNPAAIATGASASSAAYVIICLGLVVLAAFIVVRKKDHEK